MELELAELVSGFDADVPIAEAWTPPSSWYTSPVALARERETAFRSSWQAVARRDQLVKPGAFVAGERCGEPYVVVRDEAGTLRAFFNVCRHHAAEVASGSGCAERLTCPYHGWIYGLDGKLVKAPRLGPVKDFDRDHFGLVEMPVATWGPLVLVQLRSRAELGAEPEAPAHRYATLHAALADDDWSRLRFVAQRVYELNANWKVYVDNYLDGGYHVPILHEGLSGDLDLATYEVELFDTASIQRVDGEGGSERIGEGARYAWIYPNLMVNRYGPALDINIVLPQSAETTTVRFDYWFEETEGSEAHRFMAESRARSREARVWRPRRPVRNSSALQKQRGEKLLSALWRK